MLAMLFMACYNIPGYKKVEKLRAAAIYQPARDVRSAGAGFNRVYCCDSSAFYPRQHLLLLHSSISSEN